MLIDLDRFKEINDTLGHHEGDAVLRSVAGRLVDALRESDTVARFGGDEFVILLPELADEAAVVALAAEARRRAVEQPLGQRRAACSQVGASIGVARVPGRRRRRADAAAPRRRRDVPRQARDASATASTTPRRTRTRPSACSSRRTCTGRRGRRARAHFQPKVRLSDGRIEGMEVLMRWPHPERGHRSRPTSSSRIAEDCGLIVPRHDDRARGRDARVPRLARRGISIRFAVNVSARSLIDGADRRRDPRAAARAGSSPARCSQLELTESTLVDDPDGANERARSRCARWASSFALDDFGTGWSSLGQLNDLPFDELKIDRSFVLAMRPGAPEDAIVRSTIQLGARARPARRRRGRRGRGDARAPRRPRLRRRAGVPVRRGRAPPGRSRPAPILGTAAARSGPRSRASRRSRAALSGARPSRKVPPMESAGGTSEEAPGAASPDAGRRRTRRRSSRPTSGPPCWCSGRSSACRWPPSPTAS